MKTMMFLICGYVMLSAGMFNWSMAVLPRPEGTVLKRRIIFGGLSTASVLLALGSFIMAGVAG